MLLKFLSSSFHLKQSDYENIIYFFIYTKKLYEINTEIYLWSEGNVFLL